MRVIAVTRRLWIIPQPAIEEFSALKQRGFATAINNRPDGEDPCQPSSQAEARTAQAAGMTYFHPPVTADGMTMIDARRFQDAIDGASGPVIARCRSRGPFCFGSSPKIWTASGTAKCSRSLTSFISTPTSSRGSSPLSGARLLEKPYDRDSPRSAA